MTANGGKFVLPGRIDSYLATLNRLYKRQSKSLLQEIVVNGILSIDEGCDYDNWDGGTYGHAVTLTVSEELFVRLLDQKVAIQERIAQDLNKLDNSQNEYISKVFIAMKAPENDHWREETGIYRPPTTARSVAPEALQRIWGEGHVRVFLSHKTSVKEQTSQVKQALGRCGIAAFVAHEDIQPTEEWQLEIERALFSMDALVALISEDFHDSLWTDQEVGVAIGRGVPLIPIRLGMDPYGLMGKRQAVGGCSWKDPNRMALKAFRLLHKRLPDKSPLFDCALFAYMASRSWEDSAWKIEHLLSMFETLTADQVKRVLEAYRANSWNTSSFRGMPLLQRLLQKWTGEEWAVRKNELQRLSAASETEIPF